MTKTIKGKPEVVERLDKHEQAIISGFNDVEIYLHKIEAHVAEVDAKLKGAWEEIIRLGERCDRLEARSEAMQEEIQITREEVDLALDSLLQRIYILITNPMVRFGEWIRRRLWPTEEHDASE